MVGLTEIVEVHAVRFRTRLVLHEVTAVFRRTQAGLYQATVYCHVVDALDGP
jgi:hypothetical protein